ncbi:tetratricopeptide repeat protein [Paenibacillus filicis]|uniref:tetratricopeptide repeat protein n=1 Tax=Paenibacillus filicis TaxID=669464 RepID=UPI0031194A94
MTVWEWLGIERTQDEKEIKRAYARQLKKHHPEDDPQGYQQLREAYDEALRLAKQRRVLDAEDDRSQDDMDWNDGEHEDTGEEEIHTPRLVVWEPEEEQETESYTPRLVVAEQQSGFPSFPQQLDRFMEQVEAVYDDFWARIDMDRWTELLNSDIVWQVAQRQTLSLRLLSFLEEHDQLPPHVWRLLEESFYWQERIREEPEFAEQFSGGFIRHMSDQLEGLGLRFPSLVEGEEVDYDAFLRLRKAALEALQDDDLEGAGEALDEAYAIYALDPDLHRLQAEYYVRRGERELALAACNRAIASSPDEMDGYLYRARIWYEQNEVTEAIRECQFILTRMQVNTAIRCLLGQCYMKLGDLERAIPYLEQVLEEDPYDMTAVVCLTECRMQKARELRKESGRAGSLELLKATKQRSSRRMDRWTKWWIQLAVCLVLITVCSVLTYGSIFQQQSVQLKEEPTVIIPITSIEGWRTGNHLVQFTLTNARAIGLYEYKRQDGEGAMHAEYATYMMTAKKEYVPESEEPSGWVHVGYLGDTAVTVIVDKKLSGQITKEKTAQITGRVLDVPSRPFQDMVEELLALKSLVTYKSGQFITDTYVDARVEVVEVPESPDPPAPGRLSYL